MLDVNLDDIFLKLEKNYDASAWAEKFHELYKDSDRDLILAWFSKIMAAGYAAGKKDEREAVIGMNRWGGF